MASISLLKTRPPPNGVRSPHFTTHADCLFRQPWNSRFLCQSAVPIGTGVSTIEQLNCEGPFLQPTDLVNSQERHPPYYAVHRGDTLLEGPGSADAAIHKYRVKGRAKSGTCF